MKKNFSKRALSWLLTLAMVLTMLPASALAAEPETGPDRPPTKEELGKLGYAILLGYEVNITEPEKPETPKSSLWLNGAEVSESTTISMLKLWKKDDKGEDKWHAALFYESSASVNHQDYPENVAVLRSPENKNPNASALNVGSGYTPNNLHVATPQSLSELHVDAQGHIYYIFTPHISENKDPIKFYLGANGFTTKTDNLPAIDVVFTVTPSVTGGTASVTSGTASSLGDGKYTATPGASLELTAAPATDYAFSKWSDGNTDNPRTISASDAAVYTPVFESTVWTVGVTAPADGHFTVDSGGTQTVTKNQKLSQAIVLKASDGYEFTASFVAALSTKLSGTGLTAEPKDDGTINITGTPTKDVTGDVLSGLAAAQIPGPALSLVEVTTTGSGLSEQVTAKIAIENPGDKTYQYRVNGGTWQTATLDENSFSVSGLRYGDHIQVRVTSAVAESMIRVLDSALRNGGFEIVTGASSAELSSGTNVYAWRTTASDQKIEIASPSQWYGLSSVEGLYCAELNAYESASLYQEVATTPGAEFTWSLQHAGRNGTDTMALIIGPAIRDDYKKANSGAKDVFQSIVATLTDKTPGAYTATYEDKTYQVTIIQDPAKTWRLSKNTYQIPEGQTETVFAFTSLNGTSPDVGNLLDGISFEKSPIVLTSGVDSATGRGSIEINNPAADGMYSLLKPSGEPMTKAELGALGITARDAAGNIITPDESGGFAWGGENTEPLTFSVPAGEKYTVQADYGVGGKKTKDTIIPAVTEQQLSADISGDPKKASITIEPADANLSYGLVDKDGNAVSPLGDWKRAENGKVVFDGLDPSKEYKVVAKPATGDNSTTSQKAGTGVAVKTPADSFKNITADAVTRDDGTSNKDKIVLNPTVSGQEYAIIDKATGEVVSGATITGGTGNANGWATSGGGEITFDGLDPNKDYEVVTRTPGTPPSIPGKGVEVPKNTVKPSDVTNGTDANGKASITVKDTDPDTKYALVGKDGKVVAPVNGDKDGWITGNNGELTFNGLDAGGKYQVVTLPKVSADKDSDVAGGNTPQPGGNSPYPSDVSDQSLVGPTVKLPTISPDQITGRVEADGADDGDLADAYITLKPTDPDLSYAVVDKDGNVVVVDGDADGWKDGSKTDALDFGPLKPGEKYEVVAVPKGTTPKPVNGMKDKGTAVTTPGVKDAENADGVKVDPSAITRENMVSSDPAKDKITIAGEKTSTALEYAVVDPVTGEVVTDWKTGTANSESDLVFDGLDPNKKYEVVTRPVVDDGSIAVAARPGTTVEKLGVLKATGRVVFWPDGTKDSEVGVAGATVRVTVSTIDGGYENLKATSDENGYFTFEGNNIKLPAEYIVYADSNVIDKGVYTQKDNFTSAQPQTLNDIRVRVNDPTQKPTNITGGAVSDHGKPVQGDSGHQVVIRNKQTGEVVTVDGGMTPSASGGYTAGNFPDGTYILEFTTKDGKSGMTEIKVDKNKVVPNTTGGYTNTNIPVNKGGIISGKVEDLAAGETATISMNVPIYNEDGTTIIGTRTVTGVAEGEGGYWQIAGVPDGKYPVTVTTPKGTITGTITVDTDAKITAADEGEGTLDNSMNPDNNGKLIIKTPAAKPEKPNVITGAVVDSANKPIVGGKVNIYNDKGEIVGTATTGEGGGYTVPNNLPAGKYYISADDKAQKNGLTGPVEIQADGTVKGKTSVTVSDAASKLLEGTVTKADTTTKAAGATVTVKDADGNVIATTKTDANGQYFVGSVPANATVSIVTPDGESASFTVEDAKNNQTGAASADGVWDGDRSTVKPAAGNKPVIGPDGNKLPIKIGDADATTGTAGIAITGPNGDTDAKDKFEITNGNIVANDAPNKPAAGTYTVTITDTNGMKVTSTITVNADGAISDSNPITIKAHTITGTVKYEEGTVPSNATITVPGWGTSKVNTTTGKYELSGIPDGEYDAVIKVTDSEKNQTSEIKVKLKVENGEASYKNSTADATTGADAAASGSNLTVKPTTAVNTIKGKITAAQDAIADVPADKTADDYSDKLDAAINAVKAAQDAINAATEEELKQIKASDANALADALAKLMEGALTVNADATGMANASAATDALNDQKGMLVDNSELTNAKDPNKTVNVSLTLKADEVTNDPPSSVSKDVSKVEAVASAVGAKATALYEIAVKKTTVIKEGDTEVDTTVSNVSKLPTPITITLTIPEKLKGYDYYSVLRVHNNGNAERIPSSATDTTVTFASNLYSTYAILASNDPMFDDDAEAGQGDQGGGGGGSGGGSSSTNVNVEKTQNGSVKVDKPSASAGQTVIITVTPDPGFELDTLVVKDKNGNELAVKDLGNGKYSFVMPKDRPVTVTTTFKTTTATGDPYTNGVANLLIVDDHIAFMMGDDRGNFRPTGNITRAETAQIFYSLLKDKNVTGSKTFADVDAKAWYATAINALANLGVVEGVGEGMYEPDRAISRAEFVTIAMRFATNVTGANPFSDVAESFWARSFITGAAYYGWIDGYEDGTFRPMNSITRAEAATVVNNMLAREGDKSYIDSATGLKRFPDVAQSYWGFYEIVEATNAHDYTRDKDGVETWDK